MFSCIAPRRRATVSHAGSSNLSVTSGEKSRSLLRKWSGGQQTVLAPIPERSLPTTVVTRPPQRSPGTYEPALSPYDFVPLRAPPPVMYSSSTTLTNNRHKRISSEPPANMGSATPQITTSHPATQHSRAKRASTISTVNHRHSLLLDDDEHRRTDSVQTHTDGKFLAIPRWGDAPKVNDLVNAHGELDWDSPYVQFSRSRGNLDNGSVATQSTATLWQANGRQSNVTTPAWNGNERSYFVPLASGQGQCEWRSSWDVI